MTILDYFKRSPNYSDYSWGDYRKYLQMFKSGYQYVSPKAANIYALARTHIPKMLYSSGHFLWSVKYPILGITALSFVTYKVVKYIQNRPEFPLVQMRSSLNHAKLSIGMEEKKEKPTPPNVNLTFCIDTSGSMSGDRETDVKKGVKTVLENALVVLKKTKRARFGISIVGFNEESKKLCAPTELTLKNTEQIYQVFSKYSSGGGTCIMNGLKSATKDVESLAKKNKKAQHALILLSDGEASIYRESIKTIHQRLSALGASLFAIGIGDGHNKETLQKLAPEQGNFTGTYIDTTGEKISIIAAILKSYKQVVASFTDLKLKSSLLPGTWSVNGKPIGENNEEATVNLGSLSSGKTIEKTITIDPGQLDKPLNLHEVCFQLLFTDPRGRKGRLFLPWKPNLIIDPRIVLH